MSVTHSEQFQPLRKRSFWVSLLAGIFLLLSILGWIRLQQAVAYWGLLEQLGAWPGPLYIAVGGILWGIAGLVPAWGLWSASRWGARAAWIAAPVFPLTYWADRLWFSPGAGPFASWPFVLAVTAAWLVFVFAVLARARPRVRKQ